MAVLDANCRQGCPTCSSSSVLTCTNASGASAHMCITAVQVGNFRVEPPGLFRGRGEHPRQGKVKKRIYPRDIIINIGKDAPVPEHPYPGQQWREVRHDNTVTWLAYWKDTISSKDFK